MLENLKAIAPVAGNFGLFMGLFWVFKYLFYMFSPQHPFLLGLYWGFTLAVPYILYRMINIYRIMNITRFNFDAPRVKQLFGLAESVEPVVLLPLGYPAEGAWSEKKRKDSILF